MFLFSGLADLHELMRENNDNRAVFSFEYNNKTISCIFIIDINPFALILAPLGANFAIRININDDYSSSTFIDHYKDLLQFLNLKYDPNNTFKPVTLFEITIHNLTTHKLNFLL